MRQREQASSRPVRRYVKSRKIGIRALFAVAGQVSVNQAGIPLCNIVILQLQFLARLMWSVDDQNIRPLYQTLQNLPCIGRFQIQSHSTLVAVVKMPGIIVFSHRYKKGKLVNHSPQIAVGWLDLDHVGAEVGQDHGCAGTCDEARKIDDLQSREDVIGFLCSSIFSYQNISFLLVFYFPLKFA